MINIFDKEVLKDAKIIGIFGDLGTGKTALAFKLIEGLETMPVYFVRHPRPELIEELGYQNIKEFGHLLQLQDSVIYWDEVHLSFPNLSNYKKEQLIIRLFSMMRQKGNILIFSTSDTRSFTARMEAYVGLWAVKRCDYSMTKQRSKIRNIIEMASLIPEFPAANLQDNQFIAYSHKLNLIKTENFDLPVCWNEELSKPYRTSTGKLKKL